MKTVCGILILLLCTSAVRSDWYGSKTYFSSTECKGEARLQRGAPLNKCYKYRTTGSQKQTLADNKFTTSTYTTTDCTGTPTTASVDVDKCAAGTSSSYEYVVLTDADIAAAKVGGVFQTSYSNSDKCDIPSDTYPVEAIYKASWNDNCQQYGTGGMLLSWTTTAVTTKTFAAKDCSGTAASTTEHKLNECKNTSLTSSQMWSIKEASSPASPRSIAFNAIMFVFVVAITLVQ